MKIVTFNLRCPWEDPDGINGFINRVGRIVNKIRTEMPDVICFQEATEKNRDFLEDALAEYFFICNQRNSNFDGEGLMTAINKKTVSILGLDFFWLSDSPYTPGSRFEIQSDFPRICQSLILRSRSNGKIFRIYNNHLDHESDTARISGIKLVFKKIAEDLKKLNAPFFILGDFNALPDSETINYCNNNTILKTVDITKEIGGTWHDFGRLEAPIKIDYIFTDTETAQREIKLKVWTDQSSGIFLSDHYPIELITDNI